MSAVERVKIGGAQLVPLTTPPAMIDAYLGAMLDVLRDEGAETDGLLLMVELVRTPSGELVYEVRGSGTKLVELDGSIEREVPLVE